MYQVFCDEELLYDPRIKERTIISPTLDLEVGKNGTFSFQIPITNSLYNSIQQKLSVFRVSQRDKYNGTYIEKELFRGTAFSEKINFYKVKQVDCEGELSFFNDTIVRPYSYEGNVKNLFEQYVNNHNKQVNNSKKFYPRRCTVTDPNNYITRANINYPSTKEEMGEKLLDILGGHFESGQLENGGRYIDYLSEYEKISSQTIEFEKNLLDIKQFIKTEDVATRIIPLGKKNEETGEYLNIKSINNGLDYIQDDAAVELFGVTEKTVFFDDVTVKENLLSKGRKALENYINKTVSIELNATDLHNLDVNIEAFHVGEYVRVISKPHGLDRFFLLSKLHLVLDNPGSCAITLGAVFKSFTEKQIELEKKNANNIAGFLNTSEALRESINKANASATNAENIAIIAESTASNAKETAENASSMITNLTNYSYIYTEIITKAFYYSNTKTNYWVTRVPYKDSNGNVIAIKRGFAKDVISTSTSANETPRSFAKRKNATLCVNASIFGIDATKTNYKHIIGPLIHNGKVISNYNTDGYINTAQMHVLAFDAERNFKVYPLSTEPSTIINAGYTETIIAFDQLITNGKVTSNYVSSSYLYNWNILGVNTNTKELFFFECNGKNINGEQGITIPVICNILINTYKCDFAFRLDQGGSIGLIKNKIMLNQPTDDSGTTEREVPDFIYFSKDLKKYNDTNFADVYDKLSDLDMFMKKMNLSS